MNRTTTIENRSRKQSRDLLNFIKLNIDSYQQFTDIF